MIYIAIVIPIITLIIKLMIDYRKWLSGKPVNHRKEWIFLTLANVPAILIFTWLADYEWYYAAPISSLMIAHFIWLFFDGIYNKLRGFNWWYTGSDDEDDAFTDDILQHLPVPIHAILKIAGFVGYVTLYLLL